MEIMFINVSKPLPIPDSDVNEPKVVVVGSISRKTFFVVVTIVITQLLDAFLLPPNLCKITTVSSLRLRLICSLLKAVIVCDNKHGLE